MKPLPGRTGSPVGTTLCCMPTDAIATPEQGAESAVSCGGSGRAKRLLIQMLHAAALHSRWSRRLRSRLRLAAVSQSCGNHLFGCRETAMTRKSGQIASVRALRAHTNTVIAVGHLLLKWPACVRCLSPLPADPAGSCAVPLPGPRWLVPAAVPHTASHARPRNEVVDLDSRSVLPSGPWGLVAGFRRRGLVR